MIIIYSFLVLILMCLGLLPILNKRNIENVSFSISAFALIFWMICIYNIWHTPNLLFWTRLNFGGVTLALGSMMIFILHYPKRIFSFNPLLTVLLSIPTAVLTLLSPTDFIVKNRVVLEYVEFNIGHKFFTSYFLLIILSVFFLCIRGIIIYKENERRQLLLIFISLLVTVLFGSFTNIILPIFGISSFVYLGPMFTGIYILGASYALLKYQLFDIRLIISKSIAWILATSVIILIYASLRMFINSFGIQGTPLIQIILSTLYFFLSGLVFSSLRLRFQSSADKVFLKGKYNYKKVLITITEKLANVGSIEELYTHLNQSLVDDIEISPCHLLLPLDFESKKDLSSTFVDRSKKDKKIIFTQSQTKQLIQWVLKNKTVGFKDDFKTLGKSINILSDFQVLIPCLTDDHEVLSIIILGQKMSQDKFNDDDKDLFTSLSTLVSNSLKRIQQTRVTAEISVAQQIQTEILPKNPQIPGTEICAYMKSADEVGGDYYDVLQFNDTSWVVVGDVAGHGVSSGLTMFMVQSIMTTLLHTTDTSSPAELNYLANLILYQTLQRIEDQRPMTIVTMSTKNGRAFKVSGSHDNIYVYRAKKHEVETFSVENFPFGIGLTEMERDMFSERDFKIEKDDIIFLGTDGITEAYKNGDIYLGQYGEKKLQKLLLSHADKPIDTIKSKLLQSLKTFTNGNFYDDLTFIIIKAI